MMSETDTFYKKGPETGQIRKSWKNRIRVALVYPNTYNVGMSNLGFQTVYRLTNDIEHVVCERAFVPPNGPSAARITSIESQKQLADFDIIAFSISFENDYPHILAILENAGLPLLAHKRGPAHPLVMAGGVVCSLNPEPLSLFLDMFFVGEAETMLAPFFDAFDPGAKREPHLKQLAKQVPGLYVPRFYTPAYHPDGTLRAFTPAADVPATVRRAYVKDLSQTPTYSTLMAPDTIFGRTFLIETSRGCAHGCRFCCAGYIYRPPRFRPPDMLFENVQTGAALTDKIGLVGAAVTDLPGLDTLCGRILAHSGPEGDLSISFSSLRADALTPELAAILKKAHVKTATIAPDAGSEKMRTIINKGLSEAAILNAAERLVVYGIPNLKLYFMVGLPWETPEDVEAIVTLCKRIKHVFLKSSRPKGRMGEITVSLNCFVPKPFTPFQWVAMDTVATLKRKIKSVKSGLKKVANIRVHADVPRWAYIQGLLARGDRQVGRILQAAHENKDNWPQTFKASSLNPNFYTLRERPLDEVLPWEFIDHGLSAAFLKNEYQRALQGKASPACPLESCTVCGVCRTDSPVQEKK